jgi:hypothetical protein
MVSCEGDCQNESSRPVFLGNLLTLTTREPLKYQYARRAKLPEVTYHSPRYGSCMSDDLTPLRQESKHARQRSRTTSRSGGSQNR